MADVASLKVRRSIRDLQLEYDAGNREQLEALVRAWTAIQGLILPEVLRRNHVISQKSFFDIAGYHAEPFQYRRDVDNLSITDNYPYWGG
mmetsp:Transcript_6255/g.11138  ORF Transcript_6255/g.11138 Transcript_6255/m.11138 type:complete len:90 (+) Transcript_6255:90-359(+)